MNDNESVIKDIVGVIVAVLVMVLIVNWSFKENERQMLFKRHQIEEATGCRVMEAASPGCEPITIPIGRNNELFFKCCPERTR